MSYKGRDRKRATYRKIKLRKRQKRHTGDFAISSGLDQRSVIACDDAIVAIIADIGFHVPTPECIEALANRFLYFLSASGLAN